MSIVAPPAAPENWGGPPDFQPLPFTDFVEELLSLYLPPQRAKATHYGMKNALRIVAGLIGDNGTTAALTPALIARLVKERPATESPNTTRGLLRYVKTACNYALSQGYVRSTPFGFRKEWIRAAPRKEKKHHSLEDIARVLDLARQDIATKLPGSWSQWRARRLYALVAVLAYCGLRKMEALRLRVEDIDLAGRMIWIVSREGNRLKTVGSAQPVPMPDHLVSILTEWLPYLAIPKGMEGNAAEAKDVTGPMPAANPTGKRDAGWVFPNVYRTGPWVGGSPGYKPHERVKRLGERIGVTGFTPQSLRHSWATHAESGWGFSAALIQRVLRHTNPETQKHYRHADQQNLRNAVKDVGFGHAPPTVEPVIPAPEKPAGDSTAAPKRKGAFVGRKLSDADVAEMKELRAGGWSYAMLMSRYDVSKSTLHYALYGVTHKHIPPAELPPPGSPNGGPPTS